MAAPLYVPDKDKTATSNLTHFQNLVEKETGETFSDYQALHSWSVLKKEDFWSIIWKHMGPVYSRQYSCIITGESIQYAKWFEGARLNFAENLLRCRDDGIAVIYESENEPHRQITYRELYLKVAACAHSLKELGVTKGDRVAGLLPNSIEPIIAMLAATSLGAIWSSCSPDFGIEGVYQRFGQIEPKVLFTRDGYIYNGKFFDCSEKINGLVSRMPSIQKTVVVKKFNTDELRHPSQTFESFLDNRAQSIDFEQLEFDHPLYILYSSGTTGKPKCIVHGAGGTLLQHYKELALHSNLKKEDTLTYLTTCGWMMWNWMVSSLSIGSTLYIYDGSPARPDLNKIWKAVDKFNINILGLSPGFLSICQKNDIRPGQTCDLNSLDTILTTGSPLSEENFNWVYSEVKKEVQLSSISGGTDIISCFVLGNPNLPVNKGQIQCIGLGMDVQVHDEKGNPIKGEIGELVCCSPFPSRPLYFWNDSQGKKYTRAYFSNNQNVWQHGDFIKALGNGGVIIYGRSDATLNPGGVRIGSAEIYNIVENIQGVTECLVCEVKNQGIMLFVQTEVKGNLDADMEAVIRAQLKTQASPRHVPDLVFAVPGIPHTMSGKKMELLVKKIMQGEKVENHGVVANPEALQIYLELHSSLPAPQV